MLVLLLVTALALPSPGPAAAAAATCSSYPDQAAAQRAADTRDPDGDGIFCESLPCPCLAPGATRLPPKPAVAPSCTKPSAVQSVTFSAAKYPHIRAHFRAAVRRGWPRTLVLNRPGADARRDRLLRNISTRPAFDRDEYPPAVGRRGWRADVRYVESRENESHGASLGGQLRRFCNGTRFRYRFF
jgi:hypothetical protein